MRLRMIEDMCIRGMSDKAQKSHIWMIKDFAAFFGRSPDTATLALGAKVVFLKTVCLERPVAPSGPWKRGGLGTEARIVHGAVDWHCPL